MARGYFLELSNIIVGISTSLQKVSEVVIFYLTFAWLLHAKAAQMGFIKYTRDCFWRLLNIKVGMRVSNRVLGKFLG